MQSVSALFAARGAALSQKSMDGSLSYGKRKRSKRPNVIFMICDDLGFGDLGCYGSRLATPNLDRMASDGLRFTRYNSAHPICSASRSAVLTGRYAQRTNTAGAYVPSSTDGTSLDETLLPELFRSNGYKTMAIGKWHLGHQAEYLPTKRGFDSYFGVPYSVDMAPLPLYRDAEIVEPSTDRTMLTPRYTTEAVRFVDEHKDEPFFLYLAYSYPHDPARASKRFAGKTAFGHSGDAIAEIDWSVGEVIAALERSGLSEDTLVFFTSDHGPWYQGCPGALRGRKASTFEGGFRVPMLVKWPRSIAPRRIAQEWSCALDILPTLCAVCDLPHPEKPLDGVDISAVFRDQVRLPGRKPVLYFSPMGNDGLDVHCIRDRQWKLRVAQATGGEIYLNDRSTGADASAWLANAELYDLNADPGESYDVAHLYPEIVARLEQSLEAQMATFPGRVTTAYARLREVRGDKSTPPGASPRPEGVALPGWLWTPEELR